MPRAADRALLRSADQEIERGLCLQDLALEVIEARRMPVDDLVQLVEILAEVRKQIRRMRGLSAALAAQIDGRGTDAS